MEIQRVILNNIGLFEKLEISLAPTEQNPSNITVFVGNNGAGKTAILKALEVLDCKAKREIGKDNYDIYRIVEVLWAIDFDNPPVSAKADAMFDYREVLNYQGGKVMELEKLPTFRQRWDDDGGLSRSFLWIALIVVRFGWLIWVMWPKSDPVWLSVFLRAIKSVP